MEQGLKGRMLPANPVVFSIYSVVLSWQEGLTCLGDGAVSQSLRGSRAPVQGGASSDWGRLVSFWSLGLAQASLSLLRG